METGTFLKVANEAIKLYRASDRWADLCVDEWQPNLTSLVSKWRRHSPASYDMLLLGLIWNISGKLDF